MEKKVFVVANLGKPDSMGDVIMPGAIKHGEVFLTKDFGNMPITKVIVIEKEGKVIAEAEISDEYNGLFPAIGFKVLKFKQKGNIREIHELDLKEISLCASPNVDHKIKPLR